MIGSRGKRRLLWIAALTVAAAIVATIVLWPKPAPQKAAPLEARIELAAGRVEVKRTDHTTTAVSGTALPAGSEIVVSESARALLRLPDGSGAFLRGGSVFKLEESRGQLLAGEFWLDATSAGRPVFVHQIGSVRVEAADSGLSLKKTPDGAEVYVARGRVTLTSAGGRAEVNAGEQATAHGEEAPVVTAVAFWNDWTGGMADFAPDAADGAGRGTIFGVDEHAAYGTPPLPLDIQKQVVTIVIRDGLSETKVDQTFFNPSERDVEGWYWFTVPPDASVTGFALETNGALIDGEFVEKREAAQKYGRAKASGHSPAILEQIDGRTYRARIYPIRSLKTRRVVLRYVQLRSADPNKISYVYPMSSGTPAKIGEFSLKVDLGPEGKSMQISTLADARIESGGEFITMRRSGFTPRVDFQLEALRDKTVDPVRLSRFRAGDESADYVLVRYTPDLDWEKAQQPTADVVVVVDTSAAGDESSRSLKVQTAEAILRSLSDQDRFALLALDVRPEVLHPKEGLTEATDQNVEAALDRLAEHPTGGATDLSALFDVALSRLHKSTQAALIYVGDGIATSGEFTPEQLLGRLKRSFSTSSARLFTIGVGSEADDALLGELARAGGGEHYRLEEASQTTVRALQLSSAVKLPTLTEIEVDLGAGLDQVFTSGGARVAKGSEVSVLARTHHPIPDEVTVRGKIGGEPFEKTYPTKVDTSILASFVPRLWAAEYVRTILGATDDPDRERGRIASLGVRYGLVTPYSSILALESEAAYSRLGIPRQHSSLRGTRLTALDRKEEERVRTHLNAPWIPLAETALGCNSKRSGSSATERAAAPPPAEPDIPEAVVQAAEELIEENESPTLDEFRKEELAALPPAAAKPAGGEEEPARARRARPLTGKGTLGAADDGLGEDRATQTIPSDLKKKDLLADAKPEPIEAGRGGGLALFGLRPEPHEGGAIALRTCSDLAARPLSQRARVWQQRLKTATSGEELADRYKNAKEACELTDWRAERLFLRLLSQHITSVGHIRTLLRYFAGRPDVQQFLGKLILRRTVDPAQINAVEEELFSRRIDWNQVDRELSAIESVDERLIALRRYTSLIPEDPNGSLRLIRLLVLAKRLTEAVEVGRRIRERGFLTPNTARQLGDLLAQAGQRDAAVRAYSEIVEFDPENLGSRQLLGDVYLRHGWYDAAYRQYQTLSDRDPEQPISWLRLAAAAAGAGRVDEALRLERKVITAQGTPGPDDPRRWARLHSAAKLARLWAGAKIDAAQKPAIERKLKELQLFTGPAALVVLTWEDLSRTVSLRILEDTAASQDLVDASRVGLFARMMSARDHSQVQLSAQLETEPLNRPLRVVRHDLVWNGSEFDVQVSEHDLAPLEEMVSL